MNLSELLEFEKTSAIAGETAGAATGAGLGAAGSIIVGNLIDDYAKKSKNKYIRFAGNVAKETAPWAGSAGGWVLGQNIGKKKLLKNKENERLKKIRNEVR